VISSLKVAFCSFFGDGWVGFAKMLAANRLQSLELMRTNARSHNFAHDLIHYVKFYTENYADGSILRHLDLGDAILYVDAKTYAKLLNTIESRDRGSLETLVRAVGMWKVPHFKLRQGMTGSSNMQPFFDHDCHSDYLKILSICSPDNEGLEVLPDSWTRHLLDLALSTMGGLTILILMDLGIVLYRSLL